MSERAQYRDLLQRQVSLYEHSYDLLVIGDDNCRVGNEHDSNLLFIKDHKGEWETVARHRDQDCVVNRQGEILLRLVRASDTFLLPNGCIVPNRCIYEQLSNDTMDRYSRSPIVTRWWVRTIGFRLPKANSSTLALQTTWE